MVISPEKQRALKETLLKLNIREEDVIERFIRSQGAGGQKVNKTSSAVYLKHLPTGLEVKMQKDRSQALNRFLAWRLLAEKVEERQGGKSLQQQKAEKIRKQKNRRLRRAKSEAGSRTAGPECRMPDTEGRIKNH
jgi:protein subunit release factor B